MSFACIDVIILINLGRPQPEIQWFVNNRQVEGGPTELKDLDVISTFDFGTLSRQVQLLEAFLLWNGSPSINRIYSKDKKIKLTTDVLGLYMYRVAPLLISYGRSK